MKITEPSVKTIRLFNTIALISAIFAALLCVLIIVNYIQSKRADPLNTKVMSVLTERLKSNPEDDQLRSEIRQLDLLSRKAFFTNRWQVKTGGLLLFFNVVVIILCFQTIDYMKNKIPGTLDEKVDAFWDNRRINRKVVAWSGGFVILLAFILTFLSHNDLEKTLKSETLLSNTTGENSRNTKIDQTSGNNQISENKEQGVSGKDSVKNIDIKALAKEQSDFPSEKEIRANWPSFRGPGSNGIAYQKNIPVSWDGKSGKNVKWKTGIPLPGFNSPVIWNDKLFLSGANETKREVYCIDVNTGKILWKKGVEKISGSPSQPPKVNKETGFSAPTLTTDGRRVYAIFANGDIIALDFDGNKVWDKNLGMPKNHYGHSSSLIMYHDRVIVQYDQTGNAFIVALSGKTGEEVWRTSRNVRVSWASPVLVNTGKREELLLAADPTVASYDPASGKELWKIEAISGEVGPSVAYADGIVYSVNEYSKLAAIQTGDTPKILWEDTEYLSDVPSPVATGQYLFLVTSYGTVACYDAKSGTKYWEKEFGNQIYASPVIAEGKVYLMNSKGLMYIFKADKTFSLVGQSQIGEGSFCTPAFQDGRIFIRGDNNLFCIGK